MQDSVSTTTASPAPPRVLTAAFVTLAVLFGVMAQQQSLAAPVGLGARTGITEAQPSQSVGLVLVHHKGHGHKRHYKRAHKHHHLKHGRHGHRFKGHRFKGYRFKGHHRGFKRFRYGGRHGFRSFRHRTGHGGHHGWKH